MRLFRRRKPTPPPLTAAVDPAVMWTSIQAQAATYMSPKFISQYLNTPDPPPTPDLETTWSNEKIVAYRTVTVVKDDGMWLGHYHPDGPLITTSHGNGETMTAECDAGCASSPSETCQSTRGDGCGWYSWKTEKRAREELGLPRFLGLGVARVLLWGTVVEYTQGYRAQYLSVDEIYKIPDPEPVREVPSSGAGFYGGSIVSASMMQAMLNDPLIALLAPPSQHKLPAAATAVCGETCEIADCDNPCGRTSLSHQRHGCGLSTLP